MKTIFSYRRYTKSYIGDDDERRTARMDHTQHRLMAAGDSTLEAMMAVI